MISALLLALVQAPGVPAPETQDIVVVARRHRCSVAIADRILSEPEFKARAKEWEAGVPVRVLVPTLTDQRCLTKIMFKLVSHGVTQAVFVDQ